MAPGRHGPELPSPALLLLTVAVVSMMTSSVLSAELPTDGELSVCNTPCCTVEPSCSSALHVVCSCHNKERISLRKGDLPASTETIKLERVDQLTVYQGALLDLTSLTNLELHGIGTLTTLANAIAPRKNSLLHVVDITYVNNIEIGRRAFSGFWTEQATLNIRHIEKMQIKENAFWFKQPFHAPHLGIKNVDVLHAASNAFNMPQGTLDIEGINMQRCEQGTFGELSNIDMDRVNITELGEGCVNGSGSLHRLSVSNSRLGVIGQRGICGNIDTVAISNTSVSVLESNGLQLRTTKLGIQSSHFNSVMTKGLNVLADEVFLREMAVNTLHWRGLKSLKVSEEGKGRTSFRIMNLTVEHAANGSLALDVDPGVLQLVRLSVGVPEPPVCPVDRWVRQLTDTRETAPLGLTEQRMQALLQRDWLCRESRSTTPTATGAEDGGGSSVEREDPIASPVTERTDDFSMDYRLTIVVIVALVFVFIIVALIAILIARSKQSSDEAKSNRRAIESRDGTPEPFMDQSLSSVVTDSVVRRKRGRRGVAGRRGVRVN
ncbi:uncharacterized protein LOC122385733 isoform X2 [Amphibalanus amphitrite]|uniref:uncharacterized protein LOC122379308 isoform X2 n=1 Tax=Amphibalanus amphitrite TaxID=1232801 RepID=UPI001C927813|nr:uncharacterized protein LOC122379308 isoform X2 [Amphibalanus amphitrite]XP_043230127.1 uncharacterized protein LOC122385733 isoform X2 [Amphibalanus amphitrite]